MRSAQEVIEALSMRPHPEGGWYVETARAPSSDGGRPAVSTILYLLAAGERSHWHRIDAVEVWQHADGDPIELRTWAEGDAAVTTHRLVTDLAPRSVIQVVVPAGSWQAARPMGSWGLVGCIVAPAFEFAGFELAPSGWEPPVDA